MQLCRKFPHRQKHNQNAYLSGKYNYLLNPQVLLLDEPFSALDFQTRLHVCDDVYSIIKNEKKTALLVTHDISEAVSMADRIVVLTARPATVKTVFDIDIDAPTPLKKREHPSFSQWFDRIWKEVSL